MFDEGCLIIFKVFTTERGHIITLNILEMDKVDEAEGSLEVYDGRFEWDRRIATYEIINGTLPQGKINQPFI